MRFYRLAVVSALTTLLTGCINAGTLVRVKPDGSGTIEQTILVNLQALKGLMAMQGGKEGGGPIFNEEEFKRTAERMGVEPVSLTPIKEGGFEGAKALFAFDDITKIRVEQDPPARSSTAVPGKSSRSAPIHFTFDRKGPVSVLTLSVDDKVAADVSAKVAEKTQSAGKPMDPAVLGMVKAMFQGLRVAMDLEVEGKILKTNADYVDGSRITLLALDADSLFAEESKLMALQSKLGPGMSIAELRPYLKDIKGVKINNPSISVTFR